MRLLGWRVSTRREDFLQGWREADVETLGEGHASVSLDSRGNPRMLLFGKKWVGNERGN